MALLDIRTVRKLSHEKSPHLGHASNNIEPSQPRNQMSPVREIGGPGRARQATAARIFPIWVNCHRGIPYLPQGLIPVFCLNEAMDRRLPRI